MDGGRIRAMTWNIWWRFGPRWRERQPGLLEPASPSAEAVERSLQKSIATGDQHLGGEVGPALAGS
jgi:hypothetical protein